MEPNKYAEFKFQYIPKKPSHRNCGRDKRLRFFFFFSFLPSYQRGALAMDKEKKNKKRGIIVLHCSRFVQKISSLYNGKNIFMFCSSLKGSRKKTKCCKFLVIKIPFSFLAFWGLSDCSLLSLSILNVLSTSTIVFFSLFR